MGLSLSPFLLPSPIPSPGMSQQPVGTVVELQARGHTGQCLLHDPAAQGPRGAPVTTATGQAPSPGRSSAGSIGWVGITNLPREIPPWSLAKDIVPPKSHLVLN